MSAQKITAAIDIAFQMINAGMEIYQTLKNKESLSDEDLLAIIERENSEQAEARKNLLALLENQNVSE